MSPLKRCVYEKYKDECELIKKTNKIETEEAVEIFIETVKNVEECIFVNIPKARRFIKERE